MTPTDSVAPDPPAALPDPAELPVIWHDLECGRYTADLALWRALAQAAAGPVLELGAGTGRVALDLAARGHPVAAVERDDTLAGELRRRARLRSLPLAVHEADACSFELPDRFALCLAPMQLVQLLDGEQRARMLAQVSSHLAPGGRFAAAITEHFVSFEAGREPGPTPETVELGDAVFTSHPTAVRLRSDRALLERRREALVAGIRLPATQDIQELRLLRREALEEAGAAAGLDPLPALAIADTESHVGGTVVMFGA